MSDHGSAGRMVSLVPITWDNDFPLVGLPGNLRKAPNTWLKPNTGHVEEPKPAFIHDDNFDRGKLNPELAMESMCQTTTAGGLSLRSPACSAFIR